MVWQNLLCLPSRAMPAHPLSAFHGRSRFITPCTVTTGPPHCSKAADWSSRSERSRHTARKWLAAARHGFGRSVSRCGQPNWRDNQNVCYERSIRVSLDGPPSRLTGLS